MHNGNSRSSISGKVASFKRRWNSTPSTPLRAGSNVERHDVRMGHWRLGYAQQDASLSAGVFRALRESNLRLLESVPRARWVECYGVHEVRGRQTVEHFVRLEAAHDLNHLRQIDRILGGCVSW
jgi:hypothetical protein